MTDHLIAGVAAGYSRDRLFSHGVGSGTLDSPRLMTYGSYAFDSVWAADASLGYAYDRISTVRNTPTGRVTRVVTRPMTRAVRMLLRIW